MAISFHCIGSPFMKALHKTQPQGVGAFQVTSLCSQSVTLSMAQEVCPSGRSSTVLCSSSVVCVTAAARSHEALIEVVLVILHMWTRTSEVVQEPHIGKGNAASEGVWHRSDVHTWTRPRI